MSFDFLYTNIQFQYPLQNTWFFFAVMLAYSFWHNQHINYNKLVDRYSTLWFYSSKRGGGESLSWEFSFPGWAAISGPVLSFLWQWESSESMDNCKREIHEKKWEKMTHHLLFSSTMLTHRDGHKISM